LLWLTERKYRDCGSSTVCSLLPVLSTIGAADRKGHSKANPNTFSGFFREELLISLERFAVGIDAHGGYRTDLLTRKFRVAPKDGTSPIPFLARLLVRRPGLIKAQWNSNISTLLNLLLDQLLPEPENEEKRYEALVSLGQQIDDSGGYSWAKGWFSKIIRKLIPREELASGCSSIDPHRLPAAIVLGLRHVYEPILEDQHGDGDLSAHASFAEPSDLFGTPLYAAARCRQYGLVERLLERGINVDTDASNPLQAAARNADVRMIHLLLRCKPRRSSDVMRICIIESIEYGRGDDASAALHALLDYCGRDVSPQVFHRGLRAAVIGNRVDVVDQLLQLGADPDSVAETHSINRDRRSETYTPLVLAAWAGNDEVMRVLLAHGASFKNEPSLYRSLLCALVADRADLADIILRATKVPMRFREGDMGARLLLEGIILGSVNVVPSLIRQNRLFDVAKFIKQRREEEVNSQAGHAIATQFPEGGTTSRSRLRPYRPYVNMAAQPGELLGAACEYACVPAVEALLDAGVPADSRLQENKYFDSAMEAAVSSNAPGARDILRMLLGKGATPIDVSRTRSASLYEKGLLPRAQPFGKPRFDHAIRSFDRSIREWT